MTSIPIYSAAGSLAAVLLLILLIGRALRATRSIRLGANSSGRLRLLESLAIDPKRRLVLLECDGRALLLLTGMQDHVVGWLPGPAP